MGDLTFNSWRQRRKTATLYICKSTVAPSEKCLLHLTQIAFKNGNIYDCLFISNSLLKDFPTSEEVWNLVARRAIDEAKHQVKKGIAVITGLWFSSQIIC